MATVYMNKKRKFQDEQLGLLRPNHKSFGQTFTLAPEKLQYNMNAEAGNVYTYLTKDKMDVGDESDDLDSAKGSNSFQGLSSSVNCSSSSEKLGFGETDSVVRDLGLQACMDYEDQPVEFELRNEGIEGYCTDKEIEDLLYSNDVSGNKFVLSSGRWDVNKETQKGTKNLTIDVEFEQYFSMLML